MSKILSLPVAHTGSRNPPTLEQSDLETLKIASQALQETFDCLWIVKASVDGIERHHNKIPFKDIPWVISKLRQVIANIDNQKHKRGNL